MAQSVVGICNLALTRLGQKPITSLEDGTDTAQICAKNYDSARLAMLRAYPWSFAKKRIKLPALEAAPVFGWKYAYQLPADHVWTVQIGDLREDDECEIPWAIEGKTLVTDEGAPLPMLYIRDEQDPVKFNADFVDALADQLAGEMAFSITKDIRHMKPFLEKALLKAQSGRSRDSQESSHDSLGADTLIDVRHSGVSR